jgi:hypothetical protein
LNIPTNFGFNWPDGFREEDYNVQVYGRRQRVMTISHLGSGGLKKKKANQNTVSNKYIVLIGWFWITRTTIVLEGFMTTRPVLSIIPEKKQNITFYVYMKTQIEWNSFLII